MLRRFVEFQSSTSNFQRGKHLCLYEKLHLLLLNHFIRYTFYFVSLNRFFFVNGNLIKTNLLSEKINEFFFCNDCDFYLRD